MKIKLHSHAKQRAIERGATEEEIKLTVQVLSNEANRSLCRLGK